MIYLHLTPEGAEFIARFEGFRETPYVCPAGKRTVGFGHVILPGEFFATVTREQALWLLQTDAALNAAPVGRALNVPLTSYQADALISLAFNVGGFAVRQSTLLKKLNAGLMTDAAEEFLRWDKIGKTKSRGLARRREAEKNLFLTGDYGSA
jgi:lysozyme